MADKKISELTSIVGADTAADDFFVVVDTSGSATKKISRAELNNAIEQDVLAQVDITSANIDGGTIDNTPIGSTTASTGNFTTVDTTGNVTVGGNLTVNGTTTTVNSTTLDVDDINITVASGAANAAAADGAGLTVDGASATFNYASTGDKWTMNKPLDVSGTVTMTGATTTGDINFGDNDKAVFGAGSDLQIYHDGTRSFIQDVNDGNLILDTFNGNEVNITSGGNAEFMIRAIKDGAVNLYYDNSTYSDPKLATTSGGIDVTGTVTADGLTVDGDAKITTSSGIGLQLHNNSSNQSYLQFTNTVTGESSTNGFQVGIDGAEEGLIWHYRGEPIKFATSNTEAMRIDSSGNLLVGTTSSRGTRTSLAGSNAIVNANGVLDIATTDALGADIGGSISLSGVASTGGTVVRYAGIAGRKENATSGNYAGYLQFTTTRGADGNTYERMRIDSSGNVGIGTNSPLRPLHMNIGTNNTAALFQSTDTEVALEFTDPAGTAYFRASGDYIKMGATSSDSLTITSSGNVGIGVVPEAWDTYKAIQVGSTGYIASPSSGVYTQIGNNAYYDGAWKYTTTAAATNLNFSTGGGLFFQQAASGTADTAITWTDSMTLDSSGNLLVGKTATGISAAGHSYRSDGTWEVRRDIATANSSSVGYLSRGTTDGNILTFYKDTTSFGSIRSRAGNGICLDSQAGYAGVLGQGGTNYYYWNNERFRPVDDNARDLGESSGRWDDVYATNGTIQTSDANEKQDIEALSDAEQRVAVAAKGLLRKFRWKSAVEEKGDDARIHFGIIAQDLQAAFEAEGLDAGRYAMFIHSEWTDEETGEPRSRMGVRYSELLAFIIAAI